MRVEYPWAFLLLPPLLVLLRWSRLSDRVSALIWGAALTALLLAFAGPSIIIPRHLPLGIVVLVDGSASNLHERLFYAEKVEALLKTQRGVAWLRVLPSAEDAAGGFDNLPGALRNAAAFIPEGYSRRVLLISDGRNAHGDLPRALLELQQMHVPVDVLAAPGNPAQLGLASVSLPDSLYAGDHFPIDIAVTSPRRAVAQVMLEIEGGERFTQSAQLQAGLNVIRAQQSTVSPGAILLSGNVWADGLGEVSFERLALVSRAKVVYLAPYSSPETVLLRGLRTRGAQIARVSALSPRTLFGVQLLILTAESFPALTPAQKYQIAQFVMEGGGLLFLGGEAQPFKEPNEFDALDQALPAEPAPPENAGDKCVVLLIDKSSSMEGTKLAMARQAVNAIADGLGAHDSLGVVAFDHAHQWIYPLQHLEHREAFYQQIRNLSASGGTDIPPALSAAYHAVLSSKAKYRHIVLITDGISEEGDSVALAKEAHRQQIAISTVALGTDVNRSFLEEVAHESGGRSYVSATARDLKGITLEDVRDYTGSRVVEHLSKAVLTARRDLLSDVELEAAPPLTRYSRYVSKPGAQSMLGIGAAAQDPLYVQWQYGLGRVGIFTSDDLSQWASIWRAPAGFDRLWANISRSLYAHTKASDALAFSDPGSHRFRVSYRIGSAAGAPPPPPQVVVYGPNGFSKTAQLEHTSPSTYELTMSVGNQPGVFRIVPNTLSSAFPMTAVLVREQSTRDFAAGQAALREITERTGGRFYRDPPVLLAGSATAIKSRFDLWPGLVCCAIALMFAGLVVRWLQNHL